ncbi:MAG: hypothetical protein PHX70_10900 [Clostridium sp.]|nr:hypothetical protein [Clostridium sp.]
MSIYKKVIIAISSLLLVFTVSFCYGYRSELKNDFSTFYKNHFNLKNKNNDSIKTVNASKKILNSKDPSKDESIIKKDVLVLYIDRKHYTAKGSDKVAEDVLKHSSAHAEGFEGKSISSIYDSLKKIGYKLEVNDNELLCVKVYKEGKYVAKINDNKYEIFVANKNGELKLTESGGNINHKSEDETLFNKNVQEFNSVEEARDSLSDFTS